LLIEGDRLARGNVNGGGIDSSTGCAQDEEAENRGALGDGQSCSVAQVDGVAGWTEVRCGGDAERPSLYVDRRCERVGPRQSQRAGAAFVDETTAADHTGDRVGVSAVSGHLSGDVIATDRARSMPPLRNRGRPRRKS